MRAEKILTQQFARDLYDVHLGRVRVVFAAVQALLKSGRLSLTCLGRAVAERTAPKHGIKRIDLRPRAPRRHLARKPAARARGEARRGATGSGARGAGGAWRMIAYVGPPNRESRVDGREIARASPRPGVVNAFVAERLGGKLDPLPSSPRRLVGARVDPRNEVRIRSAGEPRRGIDGKDERSGYRDHHREQDSEEFESPRPTPADPTARVTRNRIVGFRRARGFQLVRDHLPIEIMRLGTIKVLSVRPSVARASRRAR